MTHCLAIVPLKASQSSGETQPSLHSNWETCRAGRPAPPLPPRVIFFLAVRWTADVREEWNLNLSATAAGGSLLSKTHFLPLKIHEWHSKTRALFYLQSHQGNGPDPIGWGSRWPDGSMASHWSMQSQRLLVLVCLHCLVNVKHINILLTWALCVLSLDTKLTMFEECKKCTSYSLDVDILIWLMHYIVLHSKL